MSALADRLAARTLELVDIPSQSLHERPIRERLLELVPSALTPEWVGDEAALFVPARRPDAPLVLLAGHYDTIPAQGNLPGRIDADAVHGLVASDMKGGLTVAIELLRDLPEAGLGRVDVGLVLFGREELGVEYNPLPALFAGSRAVHEASLAILLEPTDGKLQAGCLGNIVARLAFGGTSGHAARPWEADNAIVRAVEGLTPLFALEPRRAPVADLEFVEVLSVTRLHAGIADNVIPGEAVATLNLRYPPDRTPEEAVSYLCELVPDAATLEITSSAPPGRVVVDSPLVRTLVQAGSLEVEPKQAWTNVADFTANGIDAVNFGPGHTAYAHRRDELVAISALVRAYEVLRTFLGAAVRQDTA